MESAFVGKISMALRPFMLVYLPRMDTDDFGVGRGDLRDLYPC